MTARVEFINTWGVLLKATFSLLMFSLLCSVKQELGNFLAREKEPESELVELYMYERRLREAQKRILTLEQELEERNCKCRDPR